MPVAAALLLLAGCSSYTLRGKVVSGPSSGIQVVKADNPALAGPPIEQASVELILDPLSGGRERIGTVITREDGTFETPIDAIGAGMLEYQLLITVRHPGRTPAQQIIDLPPANRRLLVRLAEGQDRPIGADEWFGGVRDDGWDQFDQPAGQP